MMNLITSLTFHRHPNFLTVRFIVYQHYHTVLPQSADCLHHIGISVSYDDSLIFSDVACLLTTKHISYATYFALQFRISCLFPQTKHFDLPIYVIWHPTFQRQQIYPSLQMNSADYFGSALHLLLLALPSNAQYLGLSRYGWQRSFIDKSAGPLWQTSISGFVSIAKQSQLFF